MKFRNKETKGKLLLENSSFLLCGESRIHLWEDFGWKTHLYLQNSWRLFSECKNVLIKDVIALSENGASYNLTLEIKDTRIWILDIHGVFWSKSPSASLVLTLRYTFHLKSFGVHQHHIELKNFLDGHIQ